MKGKADKLVANRTLSALVVLCVMLSAFAGFMFLVKPSSTKAASLGDLNIVGTRYTIENIYQPVDGNVTIGAGGELFIKDATLAIVSSDETFHRHFITVSAGGKLTLEHSTITTYLDQLSSWPFLTLTVTGANSVMTATAGSVLMFPGDLIISTQALVSLHETTVTAHPDDAISQYYASTSTATGDRANDGPSIALTGNAQLSIFDSSLKSLPEFPVAGDAAENIVLSGNSNFLSVNSYVGVDYVPASPSTHNFLSMSNSHAFLYGTVLDDRYAGSDRLDPIVVLTSTSNATVYRWVNVTVGDEYGVPISNAKIKAVYTGSSLQGQTAKYYTASGVTNVPPAEVLDYLGVTGTNFNVTKSDGKAVVPYMSDIITYDGTVTVSQFVGSYLINGSATIGPIVYSSESSFAFPAPYPAMSPLDRYYSQTVRIEGVSAQSPDPSRWLVVPLSPGNPSLEISNMTYYHSGDVIVAADGTLRFYNAEFQMIQTSSYQRTIYVDNATGHPAMLVFEKSKMVSLYPFWINITVQGHAVLKIMNSSLERVNIIASENSKVILINATMDGKLSTAWDAAAEVIVKDSTLVQAPLLSGESRGHFTNSSIPSVVVERSASAYIYRWIHVTVLDAAGKPLPGATVTTHSYPVWIPGIQNGSATSSEASDSLGVAKVNSLASILTSAGPPYRYVGNYMVSANYMTYWSTANISVGVLPYSEPLGKNATYATMSITGTSPNLVLPNLTVHQTWAPPYPVWATLTTPRLGDQNPLPGENVTVHATTYNDGVSYAYNVRVNFYDQEVNSTAPDES
ncbi:MAG: hypothetical protein NTY62_05705 [Euryarchaeota archaeon]|nr:hypothetical protein [Euryarchaeota archaeon]